MAEEPQYHMDGKPLFDILSKLPSKSLLRFRCVSKLWREYIDDSYFVSIHDKQVIEDPTPVLFYIKDSELEKTVCFHTLESDTISTHVLKAKTKVPVFEFVAKKPLYEFGPCLTEFVCSCNGLVLIETDETDDQDETDMPNFTVIHPINKQCYVLPKLPLRLFNRGSCGLGFDSSTNTFKMVCVYNPHTYWKRDQCIMVHVFGTNSWREIPKVPPNYHMYGEAIFAHGCLHWFSYDDHKEEDGARQVIWFDVKNEEFGSIKPPKTISKPSERKFYHPLNDHLVNLDDQVGYFDSKTTKVWVLNHKKEWVLHCDFEDHEFPYGFIKVLGCLNKAGDILIKIIKTGPFMIALVYLVAFL
ncbi:F-box domain-containing protein [Artemisia annua]|uniref:F-box domain-containing protein n=1 Tax=Artemisia annua TaxID=35608 RepID=A0A2U1NRP3_ARTAN|nr:F-box domain-containing protein [Artemisia annua]